MNIKAIFGSVLTVFGIGFLIYAAVLFVHKLSSSDDFKSLAIFLILGIVFFVAGISLVRTIRE